MSSQVILNSPPFNLFDTVNTAAFPINTPQSDAYGQVIQQVRAELTADGCCILKGFIRPDALEFMRAESQELSHNAYRQLEYTNVYNTEITDDLPEDHPGRQPIPRTNAFVAKDYFPANSLIKGLYEEPHFQRFIADCMGKDVIYEYADPLAGLVINVLDTGMGHPWHFDTNEFIVTLMTQQSEVGGYFEYCPGIRSPKTENYGDVKRTLAGDRDLVKRIDVQPGDIQLFLGRFSLHRVTEVEGERSRYMAIFAYAETPGMIGRVERTMRLYGRATPAHHEAEKQRSRADGLLD